MLSKADFIRSRQGLQTTDRAQALCSLRDYKSKSTHSKYIISLYTSLNILLSSIDVDGNKFLLTSGEPFQLPHNAFSEARMHFDDEKYRRLAHVNLAAI